MQHIPVLLHEVITYLNIQPDGIYVDGTLGAGGHTRAILEKLSDTGRVIACDLDPLAIANAREMFSEDMDSPAKRVRVVQDSFQNIPSILDTYHVEHVDGILLDLGWNSDQFADTTRGFSFQSDGPLDMTFDQRGDSPDRLTASVIVNTWEEDAIADMLYQYADEQFSRRIAHAIVERRREQSILTTKELADIISGAVPGFYRQRRIHPATKSFQALRIAVNDEMRVLEKSIPLLINRLKSGGRLLIISFHSIEDRIVKTAFRTLEDADHGIRIEKRGIIPTDEEVKNNPRSRSARLRIFEKF